LTLNNPNKPTTLNLQARFKPSNDNVLRLFLPVSCTKNTINQKKRHVAIKYLNVATCLAGSVTAGGVTVGGTAFLAATDGAASVGGTFRFSALEAAAAATAFGADFSAAGTGSFSTTTAGDIFFFCKYGVKNRDEH
jgi:hypothetical protein